AAPRSIRAPQLRCVCTPGERSREAAALVARAPLDLSQPGLVPRAARARAGRQVSRKAGHRRPRTPLAAIRLLPDFHPAARAAISANQARTASISLDQARPRPAPLLAMRSTATAS